MTFLPELRCPAAARRMNGPAVRRERLANLSVALIEDLHCDSEQQGKGPEDFSPCYQICLPYAGFFVWHVAGEDVVADPNQIIFVKRGESYRITAVDAYAELVVTPDPDTLSEIALGEGIGLAQHPLFSERAHLATSRLQRFRAHFLRKLSKPAGLDDLEAEELALMLIRATLQVDRRVRIHHSTTSQLVRRAKEFLAAGLSKHISLGDVGRAVGASPAYLTDVFRRVEGMSLHKYLIQLRLARSLNELPHAADLTRLALDLGFSSHSHFSSVFRHAFGLTPSEFRQGTDTRTAKEYIKRF